MLHDGVDDPAAPLWTQRRHLPMPRPWLRVRVPSGGFNAVLVISILGARHMAWKARLSRDGVRVEGGRAVVRN